MKALKSRRAILFMTAITGLFGSAAVTAKPTEPKTDPLDRDQDLRDIRRRLAKLEAESSIRDQLHRYQEAINRADVAGLERFFGDATIRTMAASNPDNVHPPIKGGKAFAQGFLDSVYIYDGTPHVQYSSTNAIIQLNEDLNSATCHSYYFILQGFGKYNYDTAQPPTEFPLQVCGAGRYLDTYNLTNGEWKLVNREIYSDMNGNYSRHMKLRPRQIKPSATASGAPPASVSVMSINALRPPN